MRSTFFTLSLGLLGVTSHNNERNAFKSCAEVIKKQYRKDPIKPPEAYWSETILREGA